MCSFFHFNKKKLFSPIQFYREYFSLTIANLWKTNLSVKWDQCISFETTPTKPKVVSPEPPASYCALCSELFKSAAHASANTLTLLKICWYFSKNPVIVKVEKETTINSCLDIDCLSSLNAGLAPFECYAGAVYVLYDDGPGNPSPFAGVATQESGKCFLWIQHHHIWTPGETLFTVKV